MIKIDMLTLFPEVYQGYFNSSIIKRAVSKGLVDYKLVNIRDFADNKHRRVDDYPTGGGAGLIIKPDVACSAIRSVKTSESIVIFTSPKGRVFNQELAEELKKAQHLIFLAGHYEGVDERVMKEIDRVISIGDYILTGGELPSLVMADAIIRLVDGVIDADAHLEESFTGSLLEYPQYTLPRVFEGEEIPEILFSGNHQLISRYRLKEQIKATLKYRPDLVKNRQWSKLEQQLLKEIEEENSQN